MHLQQLLRRIGLRITQKAVGKSLSRWLPIPGPVLIGGYCSASSPLTCSNIHSWTFLS